MENHPIPQDVTGFQFRLIGNMTVKQFAYVASGGVAAVIFYYAPIFILVKILLIPLCAGIGAALAFLPVEGRPLDQMIANFFKDLLSPTQYVYMKTGGVLSVSTLDLHPIVQETEQAKKQRKEHSKQQAEREKQLSAYLHTVSHRQKSALDNREASFLQSVFGTTSSTGYVAPAAEQLPEPILQQVASAPTQQPTEEMDEELTQEAEAIKRELEAARAQEEQLEEVHQSTEAVHDNVEQLQQHLNDILQQKQQLEHELAQLKEQLQAQKPASQEQQLQQQPVQESQNVRIVPTDKASTVGLPAVPDSPNIVLGIIRDPRGNVLPNILIEIKDAKGDPVRAFKTNGLGQFASATPLSNGHYTMEFEDPKGVSRFDTVAIEAKGEIMLPLEIISQDAREDLRRELFS